MTALLSVSNLCVNYGVVSAVSNFNIEVGSGELVAVLGSNGAGKTSTLRAIAGLTRKASGVVQVSGMDISSLPAYKVARCGLVLVPEGRRVFAPLTVEENLLIGGHTKRSRASVSALLDEVYDLFPRLRERRWGPSGLLSGGEQQMLAFGRAMMAAPKVMLLDEPSMGLAPILVDAIMDSVSAIKDLGVGVLMVEQNTTMALRVADRAVVLRRGEIVLAECAEKVRHSEALMAALLGDVSAGRTSASGLADG